VDLEFYKPFFNLSQSLAGSGDLKALFAAEGQKYAEIRQQTSALAKGVRHG